MPPSFQLIDHGWGRIIDEAVAADRSELLVVCPFIKQRPAERLLRGGAPKRIRVITRFHVGEMFDGVNDTAALRLLLAHGAQIRGIQHLHAKVYVFGGKRALVTSANLTDAALSRNHEFGFVSSERAIIERCGEYFESLWKRAGDDLKAATLEGWEQQITAARVSGSRPSVTSALPDAGTKAGLPDPGEVLPPWLEDAPQSFVKFFGYGDNRDPLATTVLANVQKAGCHWACSYPGNKRPRQVEDGAVIFMSRLVKNPRDIVIYGRAIGLRHVDGRDEATAEEITLRPWKAKYSIYVRVHHAEFVAGTLTNGIRLSALMDSLGANAFVSTQRNADRGAGNLDPRMAVRQQAAVQLTPEGFEWLNRHLEQTFSTCGKLTPAELEELDWPAAPLPAHLPAYKEWLVTAYGRQPNTAQNYASFLSRCAAHYKERIDERAIRSEGDVDGIVDRVRRVVNERNPVGKGVFNRHDPRNLQSALRAYLRFVVASFP